MKSLNNTGRINLYIYFLFIALSVSLHQHKGKLLIKIKLKNVYKDRDGMKYYLCVTLSYEIKRFTTHAY